MDQQSLYAVLKKAGCKILSFEDYPDNNGSWRVNFILHGISCEILSNRCDFYLIFNAKSKNNDYRKVIESDGPNDDNFDLICIANWFKFGFSKQSLKFSE